MACLPPCSCVSAFLSTTNYKTCARLQALQAARPQLEHQIGGLVDVSMGDAKTGTLEAWADWNCISENCESWGVLGPWIEKNKPTFGPNIIERFLWSKDVTPDKARTPAARSRDIGGVVLYMYPVYVVQICCLRNIGQAHHCVHGGSAALRPVRACVVIPLFASSPG